MEETKGEEKESKEDVEGDDAEEDPGEVGDVVGELPIWTKRVIKTVEVTRSSRGSDDGSDTGSMHSGTSTVTTTTSVEEIVLAGDCDRPLPSLLRTPAPLTGDPLGNASSFLHTTSACASCHILECHLGCEGHAAPQHHHPLLRAANKPRRGADLIRMRLVCRRDSGESCKKAWNHTVHYCPNL